MAHRLQPPLLAPCEMIAPSAPSSGTTISTVTECDLIFKLRTQFSERRPTLPNNTVHCEAGHLAGIIGKVVKLDVVPLEEILQGFEVMRKRNIRRPGTVVASVPFIGAMLSCDFARRF